MKTLSFRCAKRIRRTHVVERNARSYKTMEEFRRRVHSTAGVVDLHRDSLHYFIRTVSIRHHRNVRELAEGLSTDILDGFDFVAVVDGPAAGGGRRAIRLIRCPRLLIDGAGSPCVPRA
ncbi:hypothetical protein EVAR_88365_1 [Eumeta japonica]|uniref:Uncharacterized protein n=1 Tax=Eumeta variegata TaxID=151549 RepID=A0A4C1XE91_EUMVA|nr:hypothetical protein EVAR_88365_1 [Eumeta japonica]